MIDTILLIAALVCAIVAAVGGSLGGLNLVAVGLILVVLSLLI